MSFIASLAAVGTAVGVTGSIAAPLAGAGILAAGGAALGAGTSAAMGGDPGEGALMGAFTAPFLAPLAPVGAGAEAATQAGTQAATQAATNVATQAGIQGAEQAATQGGIQALGQGATETALQTGTNLAPYAVQNVVPQAVTNTAEAALTKLPEVGWGQSLVGNAFNTPVTGTMAKIGGSALEQGVYGAGIGGLSSAVTGQDIPTGMGTGFLGGAVGGAGQSALAGQAGAGGILGKVGSFAAEHPTITSAGIGMPVTMGLNAMTAGPSAQDELNASNAASQANFLRYLRQYRPTLSPGYAAGGITDLDGYMSNAQNIPNKNEVADPEGYGGSSVQMMAGGGIADLGGYAAGGRPNLLHGPGDGVSDDIPASIAGKQPARLASGEYVISSRIVSELGNGSTDAGAQRLDDMVKRIQAGRSKTIGKNKEYAKDTKPYKYLPA